MNLNFCNCSGSAKCEKCCSCMECIRYRMGRYRVSPVGVNHTNSITSKPDNARVATTAQERQDNPLPMCTCGAHKVSGTPAFSPGHSSWCDVSEEHAPDAPSDEITQPICFLLPPSALP